jgi:branched-chain amino acid transport system ATP-binding protein
MSQRAAGALAVENSDARHGQLRAVKDFTMALARGDIVAIVGANGAGKSTLLRTIAGAHKAHDGRIWLNGRDISHLRASQRVAAGISLVPEGRRLFQDMTVEENLRLGAISGRSGHWTMDRVFQSFPNLANRRRAKASMA